MKGIKRLLSEERGQSLVLVAIFMVVLIGFAGLAIDGGRLYLAKSQLQKAVDAGALAGADIMVEGVTATGAFNHTDSETKAEEIAIRNYNNNSTYTVSFPEDDIIKVFGEENVTLMLMPVLGFDTTIVSAEARAKVGRLTRVEEGLIIPIGLHLDEELEFGDIWNFTDAPSEGTQGNYHYLDFSSIDPDQSNSGTNGVAEYIEEGSPAPLEIGDTVDTKTGAFTNANNIQDAVASKVGQIVYVPIISEFDSGKSTVEILGFAAFELLSYSKGTKVIQGKFLYEVLPGDIGSVVVEYGTYASQLIH